MLAADFCHTIRSAHASLSHDLVTYDRSPKVSTTAFRAQPPDLRLTPLMDMDFAIRCSLVRRSRLISGFCSSARAFARRFLRTPFYIGALALRYPSPPSGWGKTFTSELSYMLGAQQKAPGFLLGLECNPGDDLLSHIVANAVPSALEGLTSVFGMGTGVPPPLRSPESRKKFSAMPKHPSD